jgi:hypothetical protein
MRSPWLLALAAFGCRSVLGIEEPLTTDARADSAPPSCVSWHPQGFDACSLGLPHAALQLVPGAYRYDTSNEVGALMGITGVLAEGSTLMLGGAQVAVLSVEALTVERNATLRVVGLKPLLIVSWSTIRIDGALDAGSHIAEPVQFGAGAGQGCTTAGMDGTIATDAGGSGGGGGGGAQAAGGTGSFGGGGTMTALGGNGGGRAASAFRGGCGGGASGPAGRIATDPSNSNTQAHGGAGGGAIRLVAHDAIVVDGSVSANGAGGAGAPLRSACGGGGGGAGGHVALEAAAVTVGGTLAANGGGGGGGGGSTGNFGTDGSDGKIDAAPAPGGGPSAMGCGGQGGAGAAGIQLGGSDGVPDACGGGGGGGGAVGYILVVSPNFTTGPSAKVSPSAMTQ